EAVRITFVNPSADPADRAAIEDSARKALGLFPGSGFRGLLLDWGLGKVSALARVATATADLAPGAAGGVVVTLTLTLGDDAAGVVSSPGFPYVIRSADTVFKLKVMAATLAFANDNSWYAQPDAFLDANPLADGPSGAGWATSVEMAYEMGVQGIVPLAPSLYAYGSLSYMFTASAGAELFTDQTRSYGAFEDAYGGLVFGKTWDDGRRLVVNLSAGRQPFKIADGMLIRITAGNGFDRAALQLNPRWATDMLYLAEARYNNTKIAVFRFDPDELPQIDGQTLINGINIETGLGSDKQFGLTYLYVPQSSYGYFTPTAAGTRAGLNVFDLRFYWQPQLASQSGPYFRTEVAHQRNDDNSFAMRAWGGYIEAGYTGAGWAWGPTLSYRLSYFSGDDINTPTYERWDPLFSGGTPDEWVQGINHYKMFQDSNIIAHRLQARLRPSPRTEILPQLWLFTADQTNNIGGTLSTLAGKPLGWEINGTFKYFPNRNIYMQTGVAATFPLSGVSGAIAAPLSPWVSAMAMARFSF
ncbi:MAG: alginate export family protein, partial [Polymorphobacter sp.]